MMMNERQRTEYEKYLKTHYEDFGLLDNIDSENDST